MYCSISVCDSVFTPWTHVTLHSLSVSVTAWVCLLKPSCQALCSSWLLQLSLTCDTSSTAQKNVASLLLKDHICAFMWMFWVFIWKRRNCMLMLIQMIVSVEDSLNPTSFFPGLFTVRLWFVIDTLPFKSLTLGYKKKEYFYNVTIHLCYRRFVINAVVLKQFY